EGKKLEDQLQAMGIEYQNKVQAYQENVQLADAAPEKWSAALRADKEQEIMQLQERIQRFQENAQASIQQKRSELFQPIMDKLDAAIKKVATTGGYVYVMDKANVLFINESISVDLTNEVKKELGM
ncbi:MAG: OmpH family outer membrane protein, partial [Bacteroidales bacterium]|nr:OmpH family outer membrane protein [Bacteroidales bacterium]